VSDIPLSVVICTHNPRPAWIARVLDALRAQTLTKGRWELIVVDNHSAEPLEGRLDLAWHPAGRIVREDKLGLTPARLRGIREAGGDLLVFVDDDNVLYPDFLEQAVRVAEERPWLGAWSGQAFGEFEREPPEWALRYVGHLAIREVASDVWSNLPRLPETIPCGAGLCVRRPVALHYLALNESGKRQIQLDRAGKSLLSGGDNDLAACACDIGVGVGVIAALKLKHLIPAERLTLDYHTRLAEGIHFSAVILSYLRGDKADLAAFNVSWRQIVSALSARGIHRRIQLACLRGRRKALTLVRTLPPNA
jgi:hypothetical protein